MILPLLVFALSSQQSTIGTGPEKILLKYKFETGDKYVMHSHLSANEEFNDGKEKPGHSVVDFKWDVSLVVQSKNVDESANLDEKFEGTKLLNGKPDPWEIKTKDAKVVADPYGRASLPSGAWMVHPSDRLLSTTYFSELPDEPVGVGAVWQTHYFEYPLGKSAADCKLKAIRHVAGHTLVDILYNVFTYQTEWTKEPDFHNAPAECKGLAKVMMVFDATEGRFISGEGTGNMSSQLKGMLNGQVVTFQSTEQSKFKAVFVKSL